MGEVVVNIVLDTGNLDCVFFRLHVVTTNRKQTSHERFDGRTSRGIQKREEESRQIVNIRLYRSEEGTRDSDSEFKR